MGMKQITLDGRIGKDGAKVLKTNTGKDYVRFSLANDSFVDGTNKTEWFDITCFDPFIVSKKSEFLKQGRYAIVQGTLKSEVTSKNGHIYLNHYVTANNIELPSLGGKREETNDVGVSTFTGGTKSSVVAKQVESAPSITTDSIAKSTPEPKVMPSQSATSGWGNDDDLPF